MDLYSIVYRESVRTIPAIHNVHDEKGVFLWDNAYQLTFENIKSYFMKHRLQRDSKFQICTACIFFGSEYTKLGPLKVNLDTKITFNKRNFKYITPNNI